MPKSLKLDLRRDQQKIRKYIEQRIKDYPLYVNQGPGEDADPISLITVGFYAAQGGYVAVIFDTRINAGPDNGFDGNWTLHLDYDPNMFWIRSWCDAFEALSEGQPVTIIRHDLIEIDVTTETPTEVINTYFGDMLADLVMKMRNQGRFAGLPLAANASIAVEEFDGYYFWPNPGKESFEDQKTQTFIRQMGQLH